MASSLDNLGAGDMPKEQPPSNNKIDIPALRHDLLNHPVDTSRITKTDLDFKSLDIRYEGLYATILDNCFTPAECAALLTLAEAHTSGVWEQAMINVGGGKQRLITDSRDCGRIIWDDEAIAERIWSRVKDSVPEIQLLRNEPKVTGLGPAKRREAWWCGRCNERMRFLRYGAGQYFRPHCDGTYETPDGQERSYYTLHLYLNDSADGKIGGGATTFHSMDMKRHQDVLPKVGRVLIFQHRGLLHSGADVTSGVKYTLRTDLMYRKVDEYERTT